MFLTSSDDTLIKLWDWDKGFACVQQFEAHQHFVMQVVFNPKDTNTFASASLDRTIKVRTSPGFHNTPHATRTPQRTPSLQVVAFATVV